MMLIAIGAMTFSDVLILSYLKGLSEVGREFTLTHTQASVDTGMSYGTVRNATKRLVEAGAITRRPGFANVYIYKVVNHEQQSA